MEEKKVIKISLSTFLLIIAIIIIIVMGIFIYKFSKEEKEDNNQSDELQISDSNESVVVLEEESNEELEEETFLEDDYKIKVDDTSKIDSNISKKYIEIINKIEEDYPESNITCDLIYFNNDNIPDLVIGEIDYWVNLYIYENGEVYNLIENWQYGIYGNSGYKYQEKKGTILNYNSDFEGAVISKSICVLNSENKLDTLYLKQSVTSEEIDNEEIKEDLELYGGYFYNDKKISEQEYNNKLKELSVNIDENNSKVLEGKSSTKEIKKQLES